MKSFDYYITQNPLHADQCADFNDLLAKCGVGDIPEIHRAQTYDYLIASLNMESVDPVHVQALDRLRSELERLITF